MDKMRPTKAALEMHRAALEEAGRINRESSREIAWLRGERLRLQNELWDWKQRYQSLEERFAENWPTDHQVAALRAENQAMRAELDGRRVEAPP